MGWTTNDMRIGMKDAKAAEAAAETIREYVEAKGANYDSLNRANLLKDLHVEGNAIVLEDSYSMYGYDYMKFIPEVCKLIALIGSCSGEAFFASDYGEGSFEINCDGAILTLNSLWYHNGYSESLHCDECREEVVRYDEYEPGKIYICPECGEVVNLTEEYEKYTPEINEITFKIK